MVSKFKEALESGRFVVTSEVAPPKGTNVEKMLHHIELHRPPELCHEVSIPWRGTVGKGDGW
jgi:hypothetical protein